jgi:nitrite reductase/ring-hydroxylating ferredoxin subunit
LPNSHPIAVEYPQAWYPLLRSVDLARGKVVGARAFSDELVAWRGVDGQAAVMARHCVHMGADLARGAVQGNDLVCPLHRLHIDLSGRGRYTATSTPAPGPCQMALPVAERYGIVFAYLGERAAATLPAPAGLAPHYYVRPFVREFDTSYDVVCLNNFDRSHFATVHGRELLSYAAQPCDTGGLQVSFRARIVGETFADRLMRAAGIDEVGIEIEIHGANLALMRNPRSGAGAMVATLPVDEQVSRLFVVTFGGCDPRVSSFTSALAGRPRFALQSWMILHFLKQDMRALNGMRVRLNAALLAEDAVLRLWDSYMRALPRISLAHLREPLREPLRDPVHQPARTAAQLFAVDSKASG